MHPSKFAIASCCLLVGSASFHVDTAHAFMNPQSLTLKRFRRQSDSVNTALGVRIPSSLCSTRSRTTVKDDSQKIASNSNDAKSKHAVDDVPWFNNQASTSTTKRGGEEFTGMDLSSLNGLSEMDNGESNSILLDKEDSADSTKLILIGGTAMVVLAAGALAVTMGNELDIDLGLGQLIKDPSNSFDTILKALETMDAEKGMLYFSSFYILAEILAIPAVPILTASSGYLFGTIPGTATCLFSAAIAASISFVIGRTLLRGYVEKVLAENPKFQSMDRAIEKEGFKLMLLLRLSPLFPFALSNYLYGASSIRFLPYFFGTLLGFAPGTFAYVFTGRIGKALTIDSASSEPWYVYVGGMAVVVALLKIAGDVASGVIDAMEENDDDEEGVWNGDMDL